jgi:hypothetical protein
MSTGSSADSETPTIRRGSSGGAIDGGGGRWRGAGRWRGPDPRARRAGQARGPEPRHSDRQARDGSPAVGDQGERRRGAERGPGRSRRGKGHTATAGPPAGARSAPIRSGAEGIACHSTMPNHGCPCRSNALVHACPPEARRWRSGARRDVRRRCGGRRGLARRALFAAPSDHRAQPAIPDSGHPPFDARSDGRRSSRIRADSEAPTDSGDPMIRRCSSWACGRWSRVQPGRSRCSVPGFFPKRPRHARRRGKRRALRSCGGFGLGSVTQDRPGASARAGAGDFSPSSILLESGAVVSAGGPSRAAVRARDRRTPRAAG